jgi:hypothetical protein
MFYWSEAYIEHYHHQKLHMYVVKQKYNINKVVEKEAK